MVAANCVPFAIGSDSLGSLRVPAQFCGVYSLFPTLKRMHAARSDTYFEGDIMNQEIAKYALGPIARSSEDLSLLAKIIFSEKVYLEYLRYPRVPFDNSLHLNKEHMKIGILNDIGKISALSKTAERAVEISAQILEDNGHEVVDISLAQDIVEHSDMMIKRGMYATLSALKNNWLRYKDWLNFDTFLPIVLSYFPSFVISGLASIFSLVGEKRVAHIAKCSIQPSAQDIMDFTMKRLEMVEKVVEKWKELDLDAVIFPTYPIPAFKTSSFGKIGLMPGGYRLAGFWEFPSGFLPVTSVKESEQIYSDPVHKDSMAKGCEESMEGAKGLPMGIEVMCLPYKDEQVLRVMKIIEKDAKFAEKVGYPKVE